MKEQKITIKKEQELLNFLLEYYSDYSRKKVKAILASGSVFINGKSVTQFNRKLEPKAEITIKSVPTLKKKTVFTILEETKDYLVVSKPVGLLTVSTEKEKVKTLYHMVSEYVKKQNPKNKVFIVHRLDQETSGIVLFAKNQRAKNLYQNNWNEIVKVREYIAVVEGIIPNEKGIIKNYLIESSNHMVHSTKDKKLGKLAITEYHKIKQNQHNTWLEVLLMTGRKNQIRVHLSEMGYPIVGDKKYGAKTNPFHRLGLHARRLVVLDPISKKEKEWISELPEIIK